MSLCCNRRQSQRKNGAFPIAFAVGNDLSMMQPGDLLNEIEADTASPHGSWTDFKSVPQDEVL